MPLTRFLLFPARALIASPYNYGAQYFTKVGDEAVWDSRIFPSGEEREYFAVLILPNVWNGLSVTVHLRMRTDSTAGDSIWELYSAAFPEGVNRQDVTFTQVSTRQTVPSPTPEYIDAEFSFTWQPSDFPGDTICLKLLRRGTLVEDTAADVEISELRLEYSDVTIPENLGEANVGLNIGAGSGIYKDKLGVALRLKSLVPGQSIEITEGADDLTLSNYPRFGFVEVPNLAATLSEANIKSTLVLGMSTLAGGDQELTLPSATLNSDGLFFMIQRIGTNKVTIKTQASYFIRIAPFPSLQTSVILEDDGDSLTFIYRHSTKTFHVV